jgi:hypothetical protein
MLEKSLIPERKGSDVRVEARDYRKSGSGGFADGGAPEGKQGWGGIQFVNGNAVGGKRWHRGRRGYSRKVDCDDGFDVAYCVRCSVRPKCDRSGLWRPRSRNSSVNVTTRSQRANCQEGRRDPDLLSLASCVSGHQQEKLVREGVARRARIAVQGWVGGAREVGRTGVGSLARKRDRDIGHRQWISRRDTIHRRRVGTN